MDKSKIIIGILTILIIILTIILALMIYSERKTKSRIERLEENPALNNSDPEQITNIKESIVERKDQKMFFSEKDQIPAAVFGAIVSVGSDSLVIKQEASVDIEYQVAKEDVNEITINRKKAGWEDLKEGMQANITNGSEGKRKILARE